MSKPPINTSTINSSILVIMPKFIGDCIMATPAIELVKQLYPKQHIILLCQTFISPMFARDNTVSTLNDHRKSSGKVKGSLALIKEINSLNVELIFLFRNSVFDAVLAKCTKAKILVGYDADGSSALLTYSFKINRTRHYVNRYAQLINRSHGSPFSTLPATALFSQKSTKISQQQRPNIGIYFGGQQKDLRFYPRVQSHQTLSLLSAQYPTGQFYLLGDKNEFQCSEKLIETKCPASAQITNLAGKLTLTELVDIIGQFELLISIDSGPLHIAAAVNTPYIAIVGFGTSPWSCVKPKNLNGSVILDSGKNIEDDDIIKDIKPSEIITAVNAIMHQQT